MHFVPQCDWAGFCVPVAALLQRNATKQSNPSHMHSLFEATQANMACSRLFATFVSVVAIILAISGRSAALRENPARNASSADFRNGKGKLHCYARFIKFFDPFILSL